MCLIAFFHFLTKNYSNVDCHLLRRFTISGIFPLHVVLYYKHNQKGIPIHAQNFCCHLSLLLWYRLCHHHNVHIIKVHFLHNNTQHIVSIFKTTKNKKPNFSRVLFMTMMENQTAHSKTHYSKMHTCVEHNIGTFRSRKI